MKKSEALAFLSSWGNELDAFFFDDSFDNSVADIPKNKLFIRDDVHLVIYDFQDREILILDSESIHSDKTIRILFFDLGVELLDLGRGYTKRLDIIYG